MKQFFWLIKRELWEHRVGFLMVPISIALAMVLLLTGLHLITGLFATEINLLINNIDVSFKKLMHPELKLLVFQGVLMSIVWVLGIVMTFVLFIYLINTFHNERRDRSVLFWMSMPISEHAFVLSKFCTGFIILPLIILLITYAAHILMVMLGLLIGLITDVGIGILDMGIAWIFSNVSQIWTELLLTVVLNSLWWAPLMAWCLFSSVFFKSKPLLFAILIPFLLTIAESILDALGAINTGGEWFYQWLMMHFNGGPKTMNVISADFNIEQNENLLDILIEYNHYQHLSDMNLWFGFVVTALLLIGATYFRKRRTD